VQTQGPSGLDRVRILSEALPFLQRFRGRTIVVKYGGAAMKDPSLRDGVVKDLVLLACVGVNPVLVHGGGPEINKWLAKVGIEPRFENGLRVTGVIERFSTLWAEIPGALSAVRDQHSLVAAVVVKQDW
jgi:acetylglutamate kinase